MPVFRGPGSTIVQRSMSRILSVENGVLRSFFIFSFAVLVLYSFMASRPPLCIGEYKRSRCLSSPDHFYPVRQRSLLFLERKFLPRLLSRFLPFLFARLLPEIADTRTIQLFPAFAVALSRHGLKSFNLLPFGHPSSFYSFPVMTPARD